MTENRRSLFEFTQESRTQRHSDSLRRRTDGLSDAVATAFPQTEFQRCIVHQVRNTLKYVATKDRKNFAAELKKIYTTQDEPTAARIRDEVELKWAKKYPHAMKSWRMN